MPKLNSTLRKRIVEIITKAKEGHIPSSFSIVDLIEALYSRYLKHDHNNPELDERDYFILSKGHGAAALFVVLEKEGYFKSEELDSYGDFNSKFGGHPDRTKVPGAEASTGSLGHGFPFAMGIATGLKIQNKKNKVIAIVGDGECHEGTIWETALVAQNLKLGNFCCIVDYNGSAEQILAHPNIAQQFRSFGWNVLEIDGHSTTEIVSAFNQFFSGDNIKPTCIIAKTIKGKGVSFLETHGPWHHKIPNPLEYAEIMKELDS